MTTEAPIQVVVILSRDAEAEKAIALAERRATARAAAHRPIDYADMKRLYPRQKAALTRAVKSGDRNVLILAIRDAVQEWNRIGAWPDGWNRWQIALDDFREPDDVGWHPYPHIDIRDLA